MEKLNELVERAKNNANVGNLNFVKPVDIIAIAEAFRALEQRAESAEVDSRNYSELLSYHIDRQAKAEAKLAELERQEPVAYVMGEETIDDFNSGYEFFAVRDARHEEELESIPLFTRPAPAINLAEPVPGEITRGNEDVFNVGFYNGWNACRDLMLRNIEEAK